MPINSNETIRRESIEEIDRMISHFSQKQALYNELDICRRNIEYYSNPDLIIRGFTGKPLIVIGIILTALSTSFFFSAKAVVVAQKMKTRVRIRATSFFMMLILPFCLS